ncbi:hypothetical protein [Pseudomonas sp. WS 5532]|uniref:hypothetical protein n=1 Tax=Pseudomonas sp. WS 5532 TaxID=2717495 RepID=UPI0014763ABF|nr:hypothetical protein [Pseudomonas sp. WS 5532]
MIEISATYIRDEVLIASHLAPAQGLRVQINAANPVDESALFGEWSVTAVFENDQPYQGLLSGLGLMLSSFGGHSDIKALPGYRCLMPEAYLALQALKDQATAVALSLQDVAAGRSALNIAQRAMHAYRPWADWIVRALLKKGNTTTIIDASDIWLEQEFAGFSAVEITAPWCDCTICTEQLGPPADPNKLFTQ